MATGLLGGEVGKIIEELLEKEGIRNDFVDTTVMTREGITYLEKDGTSTAVFEPSQRVSVSAVHELSRKISSFAGKSAWIACSGSSVGYESDDIFYEAILAAHKAGAKSILDSYGNALTLGLKAIPTLIKPNRQEYERTFGMPINNEDDVRKALDKWRGAGVKYVVLTDGGKPAYAASDDGVWKVTVPPVPSVNPVGSGDSMVAGMLYGLTKEWDFERCLRFGAAAGAANASVWAVANSSYEEIMKIESMIRIHRLS
jgi:tagatose 6-phosphate kinase